MYVVDNAGDDLAAVRHINACGGPAEHRAVLRPTPGASDVLTTGWDLLMAAGKPPHGARREHVSALSWEYGQAWLVCGYRCLIPVRCGWRADQVGDGGLRGVRGVIVEPGQCRGDG